MLDRDRPDAAGRHDHAHADLCGAEQALGKAVGEPDAAMRCGVSRQRSTVQGNARPGKTLHVGDERVVVEVRVVLGIFLEDGEDACRRLTAFLAARHWRAHGPAFVIVDRDLLVAQRNDRHDRLATRTRRYRLVVPGFCGVAQIARRYQGGEAGKVCGNAKSRVFRLRDKEKRIKGTAIVLNCFNHARVPLPAIQTGPLLAVRSSARTIEPPTKGCSAYRPEYSL